MYRFVAWEVTTITIDSIAMQSHGTKFFEGPDFIFFTHYLPKKRLLALDYGLEWAKKPSSARLMGQGPY